MNKPTVSTDNKSRLIKSLKTNRFIKHVGLLIGGTALGQLISFLSLPLLTRIYSPESFAALAIYGSSLALITVILSLRYEIAIPLPKSNRLGASLLFISVFFVLLFTALSILIVYFSPALINKLTNNRIQDLLWLFPIGIFSVGMYNAIQYWTTRKKNFALISKTRVSQSISGASIKIGAGYISSADTTGLIFGQIVTQGAGFISLSIAALKQDLYLFKKIKLKQIRVALNKYIKFPKYSVLEGLANSGGIQIPLILIAFSTDSAEVGFLLIALQILSSPLTLIGSSIAQVYLSEGPNYYEQGKLKEFTYKTIKGLIKIAFLPLFIIGVLAPYLSPYLLGEQWARTGVLISWMVPWFFMQLLTSPVSMSLHITGNQKSATILQVLGLILRVGSVILFINYVPKYVSEAYAVSGFIFYIIYMYTIKLTLSKH